MSHDGEVITGAKNSRPGHRSGGTRISNAIGDKATGEVFKNTYFFPFGEGGPTFTGEGKAAIAAPKPRWLGVCAIVLHTWHLLTPHTRVCRSCVCTYANVSRMTATTS